MVKQKLPRYGGITMGTAWLGECPIS